MLIATAGHIDHGKTSLVRALTGVDTDRLPEERVRGISIDLGFAYWRPDGEPAIGFVDVPGHERYVHNMLAGIGAVDLALLVVAADDGVMPQTVEHAQILDQMRIGRGIVAVTKCDRAARERIDAVREQARALLAPTTLAAAPIVEVSSATGTGIADLAAALRAQARALAPRIDRGRNFRLAVDRAFSVPGLGTVATGTVLDGRIEVGTRLVVSPRGVEVRVRGLQSGGRAVAASREGERCALNLAGVEVGDVRRGDWLVVPAMHAPSARMLARLAVLPGAAPLRHNAPVHIHIGTADIPARVLVPGQTVIAPGGEALVRLLLERETLAATGDRFVIRDPSGRGTIGGGAIVDPFVPRERRKAADRAATAEALLLPDAAQALDALLAAPGREIDTVWFERCFNLAPAAAADLYRRAGAAILDGGLLLASTSVAALRAAIVEALTAFHRADPQAGGMSARALKDKLPFAVSAESFAGLQRRLAEEGIVVAAGATVRLAGHVAGPSAAERTLWAKVAAWLDERGAQPFTVGEVSRELRMGEPATRSLLHRLRGAGEVWRMDDERFMLRRHVAGLAARAAALAREAGSDGFTAAQFRDAIGIGRGRAIQVLEFFDRVGITRRVGDARRMRPDYELVVGSTDP